MAVNAPWNPQGNTFLVTTSGTASTSTSTTVSFTSPISAQPAAQATGITPAPSGVRVVNLGASAVWISFTLGARTAVIPTPGNPSLEFPIQPNEDISFTLPVEPTQASNDTLLINTISTGTSISLAIGFGEGWVT